MLRSLIVLLLPLLAACSVKAPPPSGTPPTPPDTTAWQPLFNGHDLTGWTPKFAGRPPGENYRNTFRWEDGMLRVRYDDYGRFAGEFGHLYYDQPYSHYRLRFDYRFTGEQLPGGASWNNRNSGVMLHSQSADSNEPGQGFPVSLELQLLGGLGDGRPRPTGNLCTPGTAVVMGDTVNYQHCIPSASLTYDGDGWVHAEAIVLGGEAMHFLIEGDTVLSFRAPQIGGGPAAERQLREWGFARDVDHWLAREGEPLTGGYIALQAESHAIDFRNVELLPLDETRAPTPVTVLGTIHFAYPNRDLIKAGREDRVDFLGAARQAEITDLVDELARSYHPTVIAIERPPELQSRIDSQYQAWRAGEFELPVAEYYQIGFRLAERTGARLRCVDAYGDYERFVADTAFVSAYGRYLRDHPNRDYNRWIGSLQAGVADRTLPEFYRLVNADSTLRRIQEAYFLAGFAFEHTPGDYTGVDWVAAQWYDRNLRIVRNLDRIPAGPGDRILMIYGMGHHPLLRDYLEYHPRYRYRPVGPLLGE